MNVKNILIKSDLFYRISSIEENIETNIVEKKDIKSEAFTEIEYACKHDPKNIVTILNKYSDSEFQLDLYKFLVDKFITNNNFSLKEYAFILQIITVLAEKYYPEKLKLLQDNIVKNNYDNPENAFNLLTYFESVQYLNIENYFDYIIPSILKHEDIYRVVDKLAYLFQEKSKQKEKAASIILNYGKFEIIKDLIRRTKFISYLNINSKDFEEILIEKFENDGAFDDWDVIDLFCILIYKSINLENFTKFLEKHNLFRYNLLIEILRIIYMQKISLDDNLINFILNKQPTVFIEIFGKNLPISPSMLVSSFIKNNIQDPETIKYLFKEDMLTENDFQKINEYFIKFNDIDTFEDIMRMYNIDDLQSHQENESIDDYFEKNIYFIEKFLYKNKQLTNLLFLFKLKNTKINQSRARFEFNSLVHKRFGKKDILSQQSIYDRLKLDSNNIDPELQEFINYVVSKKDYLILDVEYSSSILKNKAIVFYKKSKNKTLLDLYKEIFKSDLLLPLITNGLFNKIKSLNEFKNFNDDIFISLADKSINFGEYAKYLNKFKDLLEISHNINLTKSLILHTLYNKNFDVTDISNEEFLEIISFLNNIKENNKNYIDLDYLLMQINDINDKYPKEIINKNNFIKNFKIIQQLIEKFKNNQHFAWVKKSETYKALKDIHTDINIIESFETIEEYLSSAKPKDERLKNFNLSLNSFDFKVIDYLDPYTFKVGADTDCCQRIGGAGENAAIDSFINPLAGVLILTKNDTLIAQSYFHYIPENKGLILDNVEINKSNMIEFNINQTILSKIYADYAAALKAKYPDIQYIKCGKEYNNISNHLFKTVSIDEDPRHFEVDYPYSDFNKNDHLDLLSPNKSISNIQIKAHNYTNKITPLIKRGFIRILKLKTI